MPAYADIVSPRPAKPPSLPVPCSSPIAGSSESKALAEHGDKMEVDEDAQAAVVISEIIESRREWTYEAMQVDDLPRSLLQSNTATSLLAVIDTNVLLNHLGILPDLVTFLADTKYRQPPCSLLVPRVVLHELDRLKLSTRTTDSGTHSTINSLSTAASIHSSQRPSRARAERQSVGGLARQVGSWLLDAMRDYSNCVRGQSREATLFTRPGEYASADDRILDAARYIKLNRSESVVLVTGDKMLAAKAIADSVRVVVPRPGCDLSSFLHALHPDLQTIYHEAHPFRIGNAPTPDTDSPPLLRPDAYLDRHQDHVSDGGMDLDLEIVVAEAIDREVEALATSSEAPTDRLQPVIAPVVLSPLAAAFVGIRAAFLALLKPAVVHLWPDQRLADDVVALLRRVGDKWEDIKLVAPSAPVSTTPKTDSGASAASRWANAPTSNPSRTADAQAAAKDRERRMTIRAVLSCFERTTDPTTTTRWSRGRFDQFVSDVENVLLTLAEKDALERTAIEAFREQCIVLLEQAL